MSYSVIDYSDDFGTEEVTTLEMFQTPSLETTEVDRPDHWNMSDEDIKAFCADE